MDPNQWVANYFTPARKDRNAIAGESRAPVALSPDSFEGVQLSDMQSMVLSLKEHPDAMHLDHEKFAVLDEQGVKDRTVVIHYQHVPSLDPSLSPDDPRQQEENPEPDGDMSPKWLSWRIKWKYAYIMTSNISESPAVLYETYMAKAKEFTDDDGVFDVHAAVHGGGGD